MALALPFLGRVGQIIQQIAADYGGKITPQRAQLLDNLADLATGPAALAQAVGSPADAPALNASLYAALLYIYQQLAAFDLALGGIGAGAWQRFLIKPGAPSGALVDRAQQRVGLFAPAPGIAWDTGAHGSVIFSARTFSPLQAQTMLVPGANGQTATTALLTLNPLLPLSAAQGTVLVGFGDPQSLYWGVGITAPGQAGLVAPGVSVPFQGSAPFPTTVHWTSQTLAAYGPGGQLLAQINASQLPPYPASGGGTVPLLNVSLPLFLGASGALAVVAAEYV
jgi:hypothetical protein